MADAREIVEEEAVSASVKLIEADTRLRELYRGLQWRLARGPELTGQAVPGSNPPVRVVVSNPTPAFPDVLVLVFTYTSERVHIFGMQIIKAPGLAAQQTA